MLLFSFPDSPFSQPRNVIGGHFPTSLTGLVFLAVFGPSWWSMALGASILVAVALVFNNTQKTAKYPRYWL